MRASRHADDAGSDRADHLAGGDVGADRELAVGACVAVVDIAVAAEWAVAVEDRSPGAEAADAVQDDRARADGELRRVAGGGHVDALILGPAARADDGTLGQREGEAA